MKNKILFPLAVVVSVVLISGCKDYRQYSVTDTRTVPINWAINANNDFVVEQYIAAGDILVALGLPGDAKLDKIAITSFSVELETAGDNKAVGVELAVDLRTFDANGNPNPYVIPFLNKKEYTLPVNSVAVYLANEKLNNIGVEELNKELKAITETKRAGWIYRFYLKGKALGTTPQLNGSIKGQMVVSYTYKVCRPELFILFGDEIGPCQ